MGDIDFTSILQYFNMKEADLKKKIGDNLRVLRAKSRISQEVLAEKAGMSPKYITQIENKKANPSIWVMLKLAEALDVTVNDIIY
jgi:DNA-binding XRE family transcriptional regulator